jgi:hypothetical protein
MDWVRAIDLLVLFVLVFAAMRIVPAALTTTRIYAGIRSRRLEDGSSIAPPAPPAVVEMARRLEPLGFRRIGERTLVLPDVGRRFEWNLVDESTTVYAALVPTDRRAPGVLTVFYTAFGDGAFVSTSVPFTTNTIDRPDLYAGPGGSTPEESLAIHGQHVAQFAARHGRPLPNRTMADLLARDATYRERHGGATLRRRVWLFDGLAAAVVLVTALQLVRIVAGGG